MDRVPPLWFRLPPGYLQFDQKELMPLREMDPELADTLGGILENGTFYSALGLHRSGPGDAVTTSLFALQAVRTAVRNPQIAAARALLVRQEWPHWTADTFELRTVAGAVPAGFTAGLLQCGGDAAVTVCQAACSFLIPGTPCLVTATLTSSDLTQAEVCTEILGAIASTFSLDEPNRPPAVRQPKSRLAELLT
ncbi:hypothetical protein [Streptomyces indicus]|uniref:Uncharacterized protein n=1 Tax=Streptomyces indicus TaxID=417292 RepID=A0A1G8UBE0_9ACTN|nr:hypothetical protein [Streptomyces indicus]SDJ51053.1 hypothetical protein SAMN05421806_101748 [Streptomyces indicus]